MPGATIPSLRLELALVLRPCRHHLQTRLAVHQTKTLQQMLMAPEMLMALVRPQGICLPRRRSGRPQRRRVRLPKRSSGRPQRSRVRLPRKSGRPQGRSPRSEKQVRRQPAPEARARGAGEVTGWLDPTLMVLRPLLLDLSVLSCLVSCALHVSSALRLVHHSYASHAFACAPVHQLFLTSSCMLVCGLACGVPLPGPVVPILGLCAVRSSIDSAGSANSGDAKQPRTGAGSPRQSRRPGMRTRTVPKKAWR